jgi:hypothetical protein
MHIFSSSRSNGNTTMCRCKALPQVYILSYIQRIDVLVCVPRSWHPQCAHCGYQVCTILQGSMYLWSPCERMYLRTSRRYSCSYPCASYTYGYVYVIYSSTFVAVALTATAATTRLGKSLELPAFSCGHWVRASECANTQNRVHLWIDL